MRGTSDKGTQCDCIDAERRANDVFSVFLACLGLSSPWRHRHVAWWWHTRATFDGVCVSHFFFKKTVAQYAGAKAR